MKNTIWLFAILLNFLIVNNSFASHYLGGDIEYVKVGQDSFMVTLNILRDCNGIQLTGATLNVKCSTGGAIASYGMASPSPIDITPTCAITCSRCQSSSCTFPYGIEKYSFQKLVIIPSSYSNCCNIVLSTTGCCRNSSVTTGMANQNFYIEAIINRCSNNQINFKFNTNPTSIICIGQDTYIDAGLDDNLQQSGDSVHFEFTYPLSISGANIPYSNPYNYNKPIYFWGFPNTNLPSPRGLHLDESTGFLSFRPMKIQQTVMAIKVSKYNNGVFLGETTREVQVVVINCPNNKMPFISSTYNYYVCPGDTLKFDVTSNDYDQNDSLTIYSRNLPPGIIWSDNNGSVKHPTANLILPTDTSMSGRIIIFSIAVDDNACPVNGKTTRQFMIFVGGDKKSLLPSIDEVICNTFEFNSNYIYPYKSLVWGGIVNSNISHFSQNIYQYGYQPIKLTIITDTLCHRIDTLIYEDSIEFLPPIDIDMVKEDTVCYSENYFISPSFLHANGVVSCYWNSTASSKDIYVGPIYADQTFMLNVIDERGCTDEDSIKIHIYPNVEYNGKRHFCVDDAPVDLRQFENPSGGSWQGSALMNGHNFDPNNVALGNHYLKYSYDYTPNCNMSDSFLFVVHALPVLDVSTVFGDTMFCSNEGNILLSGTPNGGIWSGTGIENFIYFDPNIAPYDTSYSLKYTYKNLYGCVNDKNLQLFVRKAPSLELIQNIEHCYPSEYLNTPLFSGALGIEWSKVSGMASGDILSIPQDLQLIYKPDTADLVRRKFELVATTLLQDSVCQPLSKSITVELETYPIAKFGIESMSGTNPKTVVFKDSSSISVGNIDKNFWYFGDGQTSMMKNPTHLYSPGLYTVSLVTISDFDCVDTFSKNLLISTGIDENVGSKLMVYPNPASEKLMVNSDKNIVSYKVIDALGHEVISKINILKNDFEIDIETIYSGIYLIHFETIGGEIIVKSFVKK